MPTFSPGPARSRKRRESLSELRRSEILVAAMKVFGQKGYQATRAEDIATSAGIAKGTLYLYFKSKESIYTAALSRALKALEMEIDRRSATATTFAEKLSAAVHVRLEFWLEHKAIYRLLLTVGREAKHRRRTNEVLGEAHASLLAIFSRGVAAEEISPIDYDVLAWATLDLLRGANERRLDRISTTSPEQDAEAITAFVLRNVELLQGRSQSTQ